ncbi:putative MFS transporter [Planoprotostelium fungivorum]|uniref:UNC93-like protein MFSD11 n=1 Tax=Planoprotostelium fungivorum TaxID=1890364 RepID=A0A2P6N845_9EUKA|nr:putative MFS transporter [Planoprotostelium fungivorum]
MRLPYLFLPFCSSFTGRCPPWLKQKTSDYTDEFVCGRMCVTRPTQANGISMKSATTNRSSNSMPDRGDYHSVQLEAPEEDEQKLSQHVQVPPLLDLETPVNCSNAVKWPGLLVFYVGLCFCIMGIAYSIIQNTMTTFFPNVAFQALGTVCAVSGIFSIFCPLVHDALGTRLSFIVGGLSYPLFMIAIVTENPAVIIPASALLGVGSALVWTTQGIYIAKVAQGKDFGRLNGIFNLTFNANVLIGSLVISGIIFFEIDFDLKNLPYFSAIVASVGSVLFVFIRCPPEPITMRVYVREPVQVKCKRGMKAIGKSLLRMLHVSISGKMMTIYSLILLQGTTATFLYGIFPPMMPDTESLSYLLISIGITKMMFSLFAGSRFTITTQLTSSLGFMFDHLGWQSLIGCNIVLTSIGYYIIFAIDAENIFSMCIAGSLLGATEAIIAILINSTIMNLWPEDCAIPWAVSKAMAGVASGVGFICGPYISVFQIVLFNFVLCAFTPVPFIVHKLITMRYEKTQPDSIDLSLMVVKDEVVNQGDNFVAEKKETV